MRTKGNCLDTLTFGQTVQHRCPGDGIKRADPINGHDFHATVHVSQRLNRMWTKLTGTVTSLPPWREQSSARLSLQPTCARHHHKRSATSWFLQRCESTHAQELQYVGGELVPWPNLGRPAEEGCVVFRFKDDPQMIGGHSGRTCCCSTSRIVQIPCEAIKIDGERGRGHHVHDVGGNRVTENWKSLGKILQSRTRCLIFPEANAPSRAWPPADNSPIWTKLLPGLPDSGDDRGPAAVGDGRNFDLHGLGSPVPAPPENPTHHKKTIRLFAAIEPPSRPWRA